MLKFGLWVSMVTPLALRSGPASTSCPGFCPPVTWTRLKGVATATILAGSRLMNGEVVALFSVTSWMVRMEPLAAMLLPFARESMGPVILMVPGPPLSESTRMRGWVVAVWLILLLSSWTIA